MATPSRRPRGEFPRLPSHPLPWRIQGPIKGERMTRKSGGRPEYSNIIDRNDYYVAEMLAPDVAEMIVKAVNESQTEKYSPHEVAEILANLFGDTCACNYNGISDWLPEHCDFAMTCCPDPVGVACWEQYLKYRKYGEKMKGCEG